MVMKKKFIFITIFIGLVFSSCSSTVNRVLLTPTQVKTTANDLLKESIRDCIKDLEGNNQECRGYVWHIHNKGVRTSEYKHLKAKSAFDLYNQLVDYIEERVQVITSEKYIGHPYTEKGTLSKIKIINTKWWIGNGDVTVEVKLDPGYFRHTTHHSVSVKIENLNKNVSLTDGLNYKGEISKEKFYKIMHQKELFHKRMEKIQHSRFVGNRREIARKKEESERHWNAIFGGINAAMKQWDSETRQTTSDMLGLQPKSWNQMSDAEREYAMYVVNNKNKLDNEYNNYQRGFKNTKQKNYKKKKSNFPVRTYYIWNSEYGMTRTLKGSNNTLDKVKDVGWKHTDYPRGNATGYYSSEEVVKVIDLKGECTHHIPNREQYENYKLYFKIPILKVKRWTDREDLAGELYPIEKHSCWGETCYETEEEVEKWLYETFQKNYKYDGDPRNTKCTIMWDNLR